MAVANEGDVALWVTKGEACFFLSPHTELMVCVGCRHIGAIKKKKEVRQASLFAIFVQLSR